MVRPRASSCRRFFTEGLLCGLARQGPHPSLHLGGLLGRFYFFPSGMCASLLRDAAAAACARLSVMMGARPESSCSHHAAPLSIEIAHMWLVGVGVCAARLVLKNWNDCDYGDHHTPLASAECSTPPRRNPHTAGRYSCISLRRRRALNGGVFLPAQGQRRPGIVTTSTPGAWGIAFSRRHPSSRAVTCRPTAASANDSINPRFSSKSCAEQLEAMREAGPQ